MTNIKIRIENIVNLIIFAFLNNLIKPPIEIKITEIQIHTIKGFFETLYYNTQIYLCCSL